MLPLRFGGFAQFSEISDTLGGAWYTVGHKTGRLPRYALRAALPRYACLLTRTLT